MSWSKRASVFNAVQEYALSRIKSGEGSVQTSAVLRGGEIILKTEKTRPGINTSADSAGMSLPTTESRLITAPGFALPKQEGRAAAMDKRLFEKVKAYKTGLALMKEMRSAGIITDEDYRIMCTVLAEKHGLKSSTIFAEFDLISVENNGNI